MSIFVAIPRASLIPPVSQLSTQELNRIWELEHEASPLLKDLFGAEKFESLLIAPSTLVIHAISMSHGDFLAETALYLEGKQGQAKQSAGLSRLSLFRAFENVARFNRACKQRGLADTDLFSASDISNPAQFRRVLSTLILALRVEPEVQSPSPSLDPVPVVPLNSVIIPSSSSSSSSFHIEQASSIPSPVLPTPVESLSPPSSPVLENTPASPKLPHSSEHKKRRTASPGARRSPRSRPHSSSKAEHPVFSKSNLTSSPTKEAESTPPITPMKRKNSVSIDTNLPSMNPNNNIIITNNNNHNKPSSLSKSEHGRTSTPSKLRTPRKSSPKPRSTGTDIIHPTTPISSSSSSPTSPSIPHLSIVPPSSSPLLRNASKLRLKPSLSSPTPPPPPQFLADFNSDSSSSSSSSPSSSPSRPRFTASESDSSYDDSDSYDDVDGDSVFSEPSVRRRASRAQAPHRAFSKRFRAAVAAQPRSLDSPLLLASPRTQQAFSRRVISRQISTHGSLPSRELARRIRPAVLRELLETEGAYVTSLQTLIEVFMSPLDASGCLTDAAVLPVFAILRNLLAMHQALAARLSERYEAPHMELYDVQVGDILQDASTQFRRYAEYSTLIPRFQARLRELREGNRQLNSLVLVCQDDLRCGGLSLDAFLIKPPQRLCRYPLLVKELIRHTPSAHPDLPVLQRAYEEILISVEQVNEFKRSIDTRAKVQALALQERGVAGLLRENPNLLFQREGRILVLHKSRFHPRYLFAFNDLVLLFSTNKKAQAGSLIEKIVLENARIIDVSASNPFGNMEFAFELHYAVDKRIVFATNTSSEKAEWFNLFKSSIRALQLKKLSVTINQ